MKILISHCGIYKKCGWGRTFEFARNLVIMGHDVTLLTSSFSIGLFYSKRVEDGVKIILFKDLLPQKVIRMGFGFFSLLGRCFFSAFHKCDIVHSDGHRPNGYVPAVINRFFKKSKLIIEWWDYFGWEGQLQNKNRLFRLFLGRLEAIYEIRAKVKADGVVVLSKNMYDRAIKCGIPDKKIAIIHGGANVDMIQYHPVGSFKESLDIKTSTLTLGFIGGGESEMRDMLPFFEAISLIDYKYDIAFINYGNSFSSVTKKRYGNKCDIIEGGWIDFSKDTSLLSASDVFVLIKEENITNTYGWPTKFGDYLACGRPILLNPYGDLVPFIKQYEPSVFQVKNDANSILHMIYDIYSRKSILDEFGRRNRIIAEEQCSWKKMTENLLVFYSYIMDS